MGYADSLFLAGAVWAFLLLEERRPAAAGIAALVATASRPNGFVVVIALAVAVFLPYVRPAEERAPDRGTRGRTLAAVAAPSVAFLVVGWPSAGTTPATRSCSSRPSRRGSEYTLSEAPTYLAGHAPRAHGGGAGPAVRAAAAPAARRLDRVRGADRAAVARARRGGPGRYTVQCFPLAIAAGASSSASAPAPAASCSWRRRPASWAGRCSSPAPATSPDSAAGARARAISCAICVATERDERVEYGRGADGFEATGELVSIGPLPSTCWARATVAASPSRSRSASAYGRQVEEAVAPVAAHERRLMQHRGDLLLDRGAVVGVAVAVDHEAAEADGHERRQPLGWRAGPRR